MAPWASAKSLQQHLFSDEHVLWSGQPKQGIVFSAKDAVLIPFSLMWGGFAVFWNAMVWLGPFGSGNQEASPWFFKLWGLPFLIIGVYIVIGRFLHDKHIRNNLLYAVTNKRILIVRGPKIMSLDIKRLPRLELSEHKDGTGTLAFEAPSNVLFTGANGIGGWVPSLSGAMQFTRIREPRMLYELISKQAVH